MLDNILAQLKLDLEEQTERKKKRNVCDFFQGFDNFQDVCQDV